MCFHIQVHTSKKSALNKYYGFSDGVISDLQTQLSVFQDSILPYYHVSGFDHPEVLCVDNAFNLTKKRWGLVPSWAKTVKDAREISNKTINARSETVFEKPAYKTAIDQGRCIVFVEGYYEHHHSGGQTFPFRFFNPEKEQLALAAISETWVNTETGELHDSFSLLTTAGNEKASLVHNNPKMKHARMPLVLGSATDVQLFLENGNDSDVLHLLSRSCREIELKAQSVAKIVGKNASANTKDSLVKIDYPELGFFMPSEL